MDMQAEFDRVVGVGNMADWTRRENGAWVHNRATVGDGAWVGDADRHFVTDPIGSRNARATIWLIGGKLMVATGCFYGTIDEFAAKVKETHGENAHAKAYAQVIEHARAWAGGAA